MKPLSRKDFLNVGGLAFLGTAGAKALTVPSQEHPADQNHSAQPASHFIVEDGCSESSVAHHCLVADQAYSSAVCA